MTDNSGNQSPHSDSGYGGYTGYIGNTTIALELKAMSHYFDKKPLLVDFNAKVQIGECVAIVGPSGHGKTTLLKILAGLISPTHGDALVFGQSWSQLEGSVKQSILEQLGMLFQKNALFDSMNVGENVAFPLREITDLSHAEIDKQVDYYLDAVGILHAKKLYPDEISGGMQKRLGIARALALKPKLIFYDDPTAGLDPITSRNIIKLIKELQTQNQSTVVAVTNDMNRAYQLASKIWFVGEKQLIETGTAEQTKQHTDPKVHQFIRGELQGPLSVMP